MSEFNEMIQMRNELDKYELSNLIKSLGKNNIIMIEVGSYRGESTEFFLESGLISKMYCIDPWKNYYDENDPTSYTDMKEVMNDFDKRIMSKFSNVVKHVGTLDTFKETKFIQPDIVYIDACHTFESCSKDIGNTLKYINPRFAISGHDYHIKGVKDAVDRSFVRPDHVFQDTSWIVFMKN